MILRTAIIGILLLAQLAVTTACGGRLLNARVGPIGIRLLVDDEVEHDLPADEDIVTDSIIGNVLGRELRVADGELFHGEQSYGPVGDGDHVKIHPTKLMVNGEVRGPIE